MNTLQKSKEKPSDRNLLDSREAALATRFQEVESRDEDLPDDEPWNDVFDLPHYAGVEAVLNLTRTTRIEEGFKLMEKMVTWK